MPIKAGDLIGHIDPQLLDGWVREEVGVTPWVGYDVIFNCEVPRKFLASYLLATSLSAKRCTCASIVIPFERRCAGFISPKPNPGSLRYNPAL
ncbi:hypothetical protein AABC73_02900 [Pseudomonas sp. G.S.17]|uniref:hypothetical protein n=1 Tax=Pseudomonas sp. G.S.17 TaxID=3137451 RepID=UPI00311CB604